MAGPHLLEQQWGLLGSHPSMWSEAEGAALGWDADPKAQIKGLNPHVLGWLSPLRGDEGRGGSRGSYVVSPVSAPSRGTPSQPPSVPPGLGRMGQAVGCSILRGCVSTQESGSCWERGREEEGGREGGQRLGAALLGPLPAGEWGAAHGGGLLGGWRRENPGWLGSLRQG